MLLNNTIINISWQKVDDKMNYNTIEEILIILKVNPSEFYEENYDKKTIDYLKEIISSSDKLYGRNSKYLRNKYYKYLYNYCSKNIGINDDLDILRKIIFGFFYKAESKDLMMAFNNSKELLIHSFNKFDELKQERTTEKLYKLLKDDGITTISTIMMYSLSLKNKDNTINSLLITNAYIAKELVETKKKDKLIVDKVIKKVEDTADKVKSGDHLIFETLYGLALSEYCNNDKILKLNPFYDRKKDTRRLLNKSSIKDLEEDVMEYNKRYSNGYVIPIDTAIDDIENLELSNKNIEDYSFYDCLIFLTDNAISKCRKENNIKLENTLLENLYMTKLLLETKNTKNKIKKMI